LDSPPFSQPTYVFGLEFSNLAIFVGKKNGKISANFGYPISHCILNIFRL
jgi:hypothetical protein